MRVVCTGTSITANGQELGQSTTQREEETRDTNKATKEDTKAKNNNKTYKSRNRIRRRFYVVAKRMRLLGESVASSPVRLCSDPGLFPPS